MPTFDFFGEFNDDGSTGDFLQDFTSAKQSRRAKRKTDLKNQVIIQPDPTPEIMEERALYRSDPVLLHRKVFAMSTGQKPYGEDQEIAARRLGTICRNRRGAKLVQLEPRGFAKTSRAVNQLVVAALEGDTDYCLIVSSEIGKSTEIMHQIQTELQTNEELYRLYPKMIACFQHGDGRPTSYAHQTYDGEPTHITWKTEEIRFPIIAGEAGSGAIIQVKTKDNLRGLSKKVSFGPRAGEVLRPDLVLLDDIQTDKDARSPAVCTNIVETIKKAALFGGSHKRKVRALMTITPQKQGDVAHHFVLKEPSWEVATYSMMKSMPTNMELWDQFGRILLNFDKFKEGDREKAQRRAAAFVQDNYEELHRGAIPSWEWCYEWDVDEPVELSATHHAMTFYYEEGPESFDCECQCKLIIPKNDEQQIVATTDTILSRIATTPRRHVPQEVKTIVTHVDMNDEILTWITLGCGEILRPFVIDKGTYPPQPTNLWRKDSLVTKLSDQYPEIPKGNKGMLFYRAINDLAPLIVNTKYRREDGVDLQNRLIGFDARYETDDIIRAIRESSVSAFLIAVQGLFYGHKDIPMMEMKGNADRDLHYHCYTSPSTDKTVSVLRVDTNHIKTLVHRGFNTPPGDLGSYRLYKPEVYGELNLIAHHCNAEFPTLMMNPKEERFVIEWEQYRDRDNEFFDNIVGGTALLFKLGVTLRKIRAKTTTDISDYINQQGNYQ